MQFQEKTRIALWQDVSVLFSQKENSPRAAKYINNNFKFKHHEN